MFGSLFVIIFYSIFQGIFNLDPHHWGLMLSNAKDLYEKKIPYKEIFIQYGIATTLIHATAFAIGKNLISLIAVTSVFYATGIFVVYKIAFKVLESQTLALYVLITLVLFHPLAIYPWSNYIAFPFLMYGIFISINDHDRYWKSLLGGFSFGLAILSREGLAPAIVIYLFLSFFYDVFKSKNFKKSFHIFLANTFGCLIPIVVFFYFLWFYEIFNYWYKLSILLPAIYADESFNEIHSFIFKVLFREIYKGVSHGDIRWIVISCTLMINLYILFLAILNKPRPYINTGMTKVSLACLLLTISALHLAEIFRLATSSAIGVVGLYAYLQGKGRAKIFFVLSSIWMAITLTHGNRGNYFFPSLNVIQGGRYTSSPEIFKGQFWSIDAQEYYKKIEADLYRLSQLPCEIKYLYNGTRDSLFQVISPFERHQIAPFEVLSDRVSNLRSDLIPNSEIENAKRIIVIKTIEKDNLPFVVPPNNFILYNHLSAPQQYFMPSNQEILIFAPRICFN